MKIIKRSGNIEEFDERKLVKSILCANAETDENLPKDRVSILAEEVFSRLVNCEKIRSVDIRACVISILCEMGCFQTANLYAERSQEFNNGQQRT